MILNRSQLIAVVLTVFMLGSVCAPLAAAAGPSVPNSATSVTTDQPTLTLEPESIGSETATVRVETNATSVAGYGANVTFDPDVVSVEAVSGVDMNDPIVNIDNENGWVFFTQSQASGIDQPELAEIEFTVREATDTDLGFNADDTTLNDDSSPPEGIPVTPVGTTLELGDDEEPPADTLSLVAGEQSGDQIGVTLQADASDVAGYGANVTFDPDVVSVDSVSGVDMNDPIVNVDNENGWVFFTQSQASGVDEPELAEITFTVQATGQTDLDFVAEDTSVNDATPEEIPVDLVGTTIDVEDDGGEEPPADTLSLVAGEQSGDQIDVAVETTVENAAGYQATVTFDSDVVEVDSVSGVDFNDPVTNIDNENGTVTFTQSQASGVDAPTFAEITFDVVATGQTDLDFVAEDTLVNDESEEVPVDLVGTTIDVEDDGGEEPPADTLSLVAGEQSGDQIDVAVETTVENAAGYQATVTFDSDVVEVDSVSGVDFNDPVTNVDNDAGEVTFTQSQAQGVDAPTFAEITFDVVATGQTDLDFVAEDTLVNDETEEVPVDLVGTTIDVEDDGGEEPPTKTLSLTASEQSGDQIGVTLETNASDVAGYGANVTFDPDVVSVDAVSGLDMNDPIVNIDNENGWVFFTQSQASGVDEPELAEITFTVQATGQTDLEFVAEDTSVNDATPEEIPVDLVGTTIEVEDDGGEEPPADTLSLVAGEQSGDQIDVAVETTVENAAGYQAAVTFDQDVVEVDSVSGVDFNDPVVNIDNENGTVTFTQSQASGVDAPTVAEITFDVVATGQTDLDFVAEDTLVNDESEEVPVDLVGTTIEVEDDGGEEPPADTLSLVAGEQSGDQIDVAVETTVENAAGYQANVTFDPGIVEVESVSGVDFNDPTVNVDNENGWVFFTQSQASGVDAPTVAEITFTVIATGQTDLDLVPGDSRVNNESEDVPVDLEGTTIDVEDDGGEEPPADTLSLVAGEQSGDQIGVTLETNAADVAGYGANVTFDPDVVSVDAVSGLDMNDPIVNIDNENGSVFFTQSQASGIDEPELAEITFDVQATGQTDLEFVAEDTSVNNATPEEIPVDLRGTTIDVEANAGGGGGGFPAPAPSPNAEPASFQIDAVDVSPEAVTVGESVTLAITVSNVGDSGGAYEVPIETDDATLGSERVVLAGDETKTIEFTHTFTEPGTVSLFVDGTEAGEIDVTEPSDSTGDDPAEGSADESTNSSNTSTSMTDRVVEMPGFTPVSALVAVLSIVLFAGLRARP
ncbi:cohesin domain-containing protein [Halovivax cerinus]|uniref:Cohesin domain-containing protein n=1 Tax=Halovivax cerinus TaxID=1487865 RepID=A0ABD5NPX1_9EURY|nr:cohesin domain-containing protein [Halovivax cerinus]